MPRYSVLSAHHDHWLQVQWKGTFTPDGYEDDTPVVLNKTDIETVGNRDQITIRDSCALLRAPANCTCVAIDLYLPPKIIKVIVHKFGNRNAYCFFRWRGQYSYAGIDLDKDPFHV